MKKYAVKEIQTWSTIVEVEAEDEIGAYEEAFEMYNSTIDAPELTHFEEERFEVLGENEDD